MRSIPSIDVHTHIHPHTHTHPSSTSNATSTAKLSSTPAHNQCDARAFCLLFSETCLVSVCVCVSVSFFPKACAKRRRRVRVERKKAGIEGVGKRKGRRSERRAKGKMKV